MHQVTLEQLSVRIPRCLSQWSCEDVCSWLAFNQIQFDAGKIHSYCINGTKAKQMTPADWMNQFSFTKFIAKQIVQWLDEEADEFDTLIKESSVHSEHPSINEISLQNFQLPEKQTQAAEMPKFLHQNYHKPNIDQINLQKVGKQQIKSSPQINQQSQQISESESESVGNQSDLRSSGKLSSQHSSFRQSPYENDREDRDQILSLKNEQKNKLADLEMRKNSSQVATKNNSQASNKVQIPPLAKHANRDVGVFEKQVMNVVRSKKDEVRLLNERLKNKHKEISKTPKLYSYINANYSSNQNIGLNKGVLKKVTSAQEIPNPKKMSWVESENQMKAKADLSPTPLSNGLQNPHVKFVSSEFIPYPGQNSGLKIKCQKMMKITYAGVQKMIFGYSKIGRAANNDIILAEESVSRTHAEIVRILKPNGDTNYILKDLGSKFGTYVECRGVQEDIQGETYFVGDSEIQIISIEVNKSPINSYKKPTFDLKIKIDKEREMVLLNRLNVYIGNRLSSDVKLESSCESARIWMDKNRKFFIEAVEGKIYTKLKQHQPWHIQSHVDTNGKVEVVFGWFKVNFELIQTCAICTKKISNCACSAEQDSCKKNKPY